MSIEELRAAQDAATSWRTFSEALSKQLEAAMASVETHVRARIGLELVSERRRLLARSNQIFAWIEHSENLLEMRATHLPDEKVMVGNLGCDFTRQAEGPLQMRAFEHRFDLKEKMMIFETRAVANTPWIPLRVSRNHRDWIYLWWRGPEDNDRLVTAIVNAFDNIADASDFELAGRLAFPEVKPYNPGCAVLTLGLVASVLIVLELLRN